MEPKPIVELHTFLGILLMNSGNTDIIFCNYYHLQSVRFEFIDLIAAQKCCPTKSIIDIFLNHW